MYRRLRDRLKERYRRFEKCFGRWLVRILLAMLSSMVFAASSFIYYVYFNRNGLPSIDPLVKFDTPSIGAIYDAKGRPVVYLAHEYRWIVGYEKISPIMVRAILAIEDDGFFNHNGVAYWSFARALGINFGDTFSSTLRNGRFTPNFSQGASTLTQQIVRLYFLSEITKREREDKLIVENFLTITLNKIGEWTGLYQTWHVNKVWRKFFEEWRMAFWVEEEFTRMYGSKEEAKKQIFARFASFTYFGDGSYGVDASSERYFGKRVWELNYDDADKAALLAGMIRSPLLFSPRYARTEKDEERVIRRRNRVISEMAEENFILDGDEERFKSRPIEIIKKSLVKTSAPSAVSGIAKEVKNYKLSSEDLFFGRIAINSTIDLDIQRIGNQALENGLAAYEERHPEAKGKIQGSFIVLRNRDAAILAQSGGRKFYKGRQYKYSDLNRVVRARQAGSAFKPFVYLTAFINGKNPDDKISDSPVPISMGYGRGNHWVSNYDKKFLGTITLCEALYRSRNAPTVRLTKQLGYGSFEESGMKKIIDVVKLLGIKSPFHSAVDHKNRTVYYPTSALGASEMTLAELSNAYREIASDISAEPYMIWQVTDREGKVIFEKQSSVAPSKIDQASLKMTRSCLRKVITQPGGTAYSLTLEGFPIQVMGKTGTTNDERNALFIGSTYGPQGITVGVRIDFDDNRVLGAKETGAKTALPVFKEIMLNAYNGGLVKIIPTFPENNETVP